MLPPLAEAREVARGTARRTAFLVAGGVLVMIGVGFLLSALWLVVEEAFNALAASLLVAGVLLGVGLLVLGLAPRQPRFTSVDARLRHTAGKGGLYQPTGAFPPVAEAFLFGLAVAMQIKNRRR
ncbi:MAG: hypothetical protein JJU15_11535 [Pararhodobacter sp.]|nr:hypothetical protein [Pararhodobacter sp.]